MNYFKVFSFIWGILMICVRALIHFLPKQWNDFELNKAYSQGKPTWINYIGGVSLGIVGMTWYMELTTDIDLSWILSLLISLTLIKVSMLLFRYDAFRDFVKKALLEDRRIINQINIVSVILGVTLIGLSIFIY